MENTAPSLELFTRLEIALEERNEAADAFDTFKQDSVMAHAPAPGDEPTITSDDAADAAAGEVDEFSAEVRGLLNDASDADLTKRLRSVGRRSGSPGSRSAARRDQASRSRDLIDV